MFQKMKKSDGNYYSLLEVALKLELEMDPQLFPNCQVCEDAKAIYVLPNCGHSLCGTCIVQLTARVCPFCRAAMALKPIMLQGIDHGVPDVVIRQNNAAMNTIWAPAAISRVRYARSDDIMHNIVDISTAEFTAPNYPTEKWAWLTDPTTPILDTVIAHPPTTMYPAISSTSHNVHEDWWFTPFDTPLVEVVSNCVVHVSPGLSSRWYITLDPSNDSVRHAIQVCESAVGHENPRHRVRSEIQLRHHISITPTLGVYSHGRVDLLNGGISNQRIIFKSIVIGCRGVWKRGDTMGCRWHVLKVV